jgi:hypothetical protein
MFLLIAERESTMDLLLGQYEIRLKTQVQDSVVAEIFHWNKSDVNTNITPIGHLIATHEPYSEPFLPHWAIELFLRVDVKYSSDKSETIVVSNPKRQAGPNKTLLKYLLNIKESNLPYYHPDLPTEIIDYLLRLDMCNEPIGMNICHYTYAGFRERGQLWESEDED